MSFSVENAVTELLPCPFCGLSDIDLFHDTSGDYEKHWSWGVECCNCRMGYQDNYTEQDAINKWNKRAVI